MGDPILGEPRVWSIKNQKNVLYDYVNAIQKTQIWLDQETTDTNSISKWCIKCTYVNSYSRTEYVKKDNSQVLLFSLKKKIIFVKSKKMIKVFLIVFQNYMFPWDQIK